MKRAAAGFVVGRVLVLALVLGAATGTRFPDLTLSPVEPVPSAAESTHSYFAAKEVQGSPVPLAPALSIVPADDPSKAQGTGGSVEAGQGEGKQEAVGELGQGTASLAPPATRATTPKLALSAPPHPASPPAAKGPALSLANTNTPQTSAPSSEDLMKVISDVLDSMQPSPSYTASDILQLSPKPDPQHQATPSSKGKEEQSKSNENQLPEDPTKEPATNSNPEPAPVAPSELAAHANADAPSIAKIFYLNMDTDEKRRTHMEALLHAEGLDFERLPGVVGTEITEEKYGRLFKGSQKPLTIQDSQPLRSMACDLAHRLAYEKVAQQPDGLYLILEDDVEFAPEWKQKVAEAWHHLPDGWVMARAGMWGRVNPEDKANDYWYMSNRPKMEHGWEEDKAFYFGAHAILFTPNKAREFVELLKEKPLIYADWYTGTELGPSYVMTSNVIKVTSGMGSTKECGSASECAKHPPNAAETKEDPFVMDNEEAAQTNATPDPGKTKGEGEAMPEPEGKQKPTMIGKKSNIA